MDKILAILAVTMLSGCASLINAGFAGVEIARDSAGRCSINVKDGKEYAGRLIMFDGSVCTLVVQESGARSFKGQAISAKAATILPVNDLADLLK